MTEKRPPALEGEGGVESPDAMAERLRESERLHRDLTGALDQAFCTIEMLFDDQDRAIDYLILEVNPAFAGQTGLVDPVGKTMRQLYPAHEAFWYVAAILQPAVRPVSGRVRVSGSCKHEGRYGCR